MRNHQVETKDFFELKEVQLAYGPSLNGQKKLSAIIDFANGEIAYVIKDGPEEENALSLDQAIKIYNSF